MFLWKETMDYTTASKQELLDEMKRLMDNIGAKVSVGIKTPFLDLPQILLPGEVPVGVLSGNVDNKVVLVVLTNQRLISHYKGPFGGSETSTINLRNIVSVDSKSGLLSAEVSVKAGSAKMDISGIEKNVAPKLIHLIDTARTYIPTVPHSQTQPTPTQAEPVEAPVAPAPAEQKTSVKAEVARLQQNNAVQHTEEKKKTSKLKIVAGVLCALVAIGLFAESDDEASESTTVATKQTVQNEKVEEQANLGITKTQFEKRFNKFVKEFNSNSDSLKLARLTLEKQGENKKNVVYNACPDKGVCFIVTSDKHSSNLTEIVVISTGDGTFKSGALAVSNILTATAASIPTVKDKAEVGETVIDALSGVKMDGDKKVTNYGGYTLSYSMSSTIGNWFIITKKK